MNKDIQGDFQIWISVPLKYVIHCNYIRSEFDSSRFYFTCSLFRHLILEKSLGGTVEYSLDLNICSI